MKNFFLNTWILVIYIKVQIIVIISRLAENIGDRVVNWFIQMIWRDVFIESFFAEHTLYMNGNSGQNCFDAYLFKWLNSFLKRCYTTEVHVWKHRAIDYQMSRKFFITHWNLYHFMFWRNLITIRSKFLDFFLIFTRLYELFNDTKNFFESKSKLLRKSYFS